MIRTRRGHFVLAMARETLLPVVVTGRDARSFSDRLAEQVSAMLGSYGVPAEAVEREREAMRHVVHTRTDDRSNVGVLTEFQRLLAFDLAELTELSTCKLFGVERPRRDWWQPRDETVVNRRRATVRACSSGTSCRHSRKRASLTAW